MAIVVAHGAGSTGTAACELLGIARAPDVLLVEDRTGDVDSVVSGIEAAVTSVPRVSHVIGVSLGAHAAARWAAQTRPRHLSEHLVCVLPAWGAGVGSAAAATATASARIAQDGIAATLAALGAAPGSPDVLSALTLAWAEYADAELARCLDTASRTAGPSAFELGRIAHQATFVGWHHDDFHPAAVARDWARRVPGSRIALAARPEARLLRNALGTTLGVIPARSWGPPRAVASPAPHRGA